LRQRGSPDLVLIAAQARNTLGLNDKPSGATFVVLHEPALGYSQRHPNAMLDRQRLTSKDRYIRFPLAF